MWSQVYRRSTKRGRVGGSVPESLTFSGATFDLERAYGPLLVGIALATPVAVYILLGVLFGELLNRAARAGLSVGYFVLYWCGMWSAPEAFYWLTGALENQLPVPIAMLIVAALCRIGHWSGGWRAAGIVGLTTAAGCMVAFHELYGSIFVLVLAAGVAVAFVTVREAVGAGRQLS